MLRFHNSSLYSIEIVIDIRTLPIQQLSKVTLHQHNKRYSRDDRPRCQTDQRKQFGIFPGQIRSLL